MKHTTIALLLAFGLTGCAANLPMTYLVLSPTAGPVYADAGPDVAVGRVSMPSVLDRSFLMTGHGENVLNINYNAQWAAPLAGMAQTILARDLAARLPDHRVLMPGDTIPSNASVVSVNVITFLPYLDHVVLEADWSAADATGKTGQGDRVVITTPSSSSPQAQAQSMSVALGQLADKIAEELAGSN